MTAPITDEARDKLKERLDAIHKARKPLLEAVKPFYDSLRALDELHDQAVEEAGVELLDEQCQCETCDRLLIKGDRGIRCSDGPVLCEACAPTWADILAQYREPGFTPEDPEAHAEALATAEAEVAAGRGGDKHLEVL